MDDDREESAGHDRWRVVAVVPHTHWDRERSGDSITCAGAGMCKLTWVFSYLHVHTRTRRVSGC